MCCRDSYRQVFKWLQPFRRRGTPGRSTFCEARQRLGVAPVVQLAQQVVQLQATPQTPGAFYHGLRLMALDSFVVDVADSVAKARVFGRPGSGRSPAAFPQARVLALCEVGTHVLYQTQIKPCCRSEVTMAPVLLRALRPDMLLLWDRGFLSYQLVQQVRRRGAHLLARIKNNLVFRPLRRLSDGSYLAKLCPSPRHRDRDEAGIMVLAEKAAGTSALSSANQEVPSEGRPVELNGIAAKRDCQGTGAGSGSLTTASGLMSSSRMIETSAGA